MKQRPGRLWLFFYGRQRRGVPWLLIGVVVGVLVLAITFAVPGGPEMWRAVAPVLIGVLVVVAIVAALAAMVRPRRR
ncbi:MAG TPA: hypothetical protein VF383_13915 [Candidatus Dormibacteraeota bacterium]